jgi:hypothetical protein
VPEAPLGVLGKNTKGRQGPEKALERRRMCLHPVREFVGCQRIRFEDIGDAEPGNDVDRLDDERIGPDEIHDSRHVSPPLSLVDDSLR